MTTVETNYSEADWQHILQSLEKQFGKKPDVQTITFLVGHRELGKAQVKFSKEQKQDLMHVGVCALLSRANYYIYIADDADGWPHYEYNRTMPKLDAEQQENLLKKSIIEYFKEYAI